MITDKQVEFVCKHFATMRSAEIREITGLSRRQLKKIIDVNGLRKSNQLIAEIRLKALAAKKAMLEAKKLHNKEQSEPKQIVKCWKPIKENPKANPKTDNFVKFGEKHKSNKQKLTDELHSLEKELSRIELSSKRASEIINRINQIEIMTN